MTKIMHQKIKTNFNYYGNIFKPLFLILIVLILFINILGLIENESSLIDTLIGSIIAFIISYYAFYKSRMLATVKEKKEMAYIPIIKELINNLNLMENKYFVSIEDIDSNKFSFKIINQIMFNKEYYLIPSNIHLWINDYTKSYNRFTETYKNEYNTFIDFLNFQNRKYSVNIPKDYYSELFFQKCIKSIYKKDKEIIGELKLLNDKNIEVKLTDEFFYWCNNKYDDNLIIRNRTELYCDLKELLEVLQYLVNMINKKYLRIIEYI